jgi:hypothetical protein
MKSGQFGEHTVPNKKLPDVHDEQLTLLESVQVAHQGLQLAQTSVALLPKYPSGH